MGQRETLFNPPQPSTAETHWQHRAANQTVNQPRRRMTKKAEAETLIWVRIKIKKLSSAATTGIKDEVLVSFNKNVWK